MCRYLRAKYVDAVCSMLVAGFMCGAYVMLYVCLCMSVMLTRSVELMVVTMISHSDSTRARGSDRGYDDVSCAPTLLDRIDRRSLRYNGPYSSRSHARPRTVAGLG